MKEADLAWKLWNLSHKAGEYTEREDDAKWEAVNAEFNETLSRALADARADVYEAQMDCKRAQDAATSWKVEVDELYEQLAAVTRDRDEAVKAVRKMAETLDFYGVAWLPSHPKEPPQ